VILANQLADKVGGQGGIGAVAAHGPRVAQQIAEAFGATFWYALALVAVAFVVALVLLPKDKPEPVYDPDAPEAAEAPALSMVG